MPIETNTPAESGGLADVVAERTDSPSDVVAQPAETLPPASDAVADTPSDTDSGTDAGTASDTDSETSSDAPSERGDILSPSPVGTQSVGANSVSPQPLAASQQRITDNLAQLLDALPARLRAALDRETAGQDLIEVVMDLGRNAEARLHNNRVIELLPESPDPSDYNNEVTQADLDHVVERIGDFGFDNRAGIERTLHRISAIRNRRDRVVGLTMRIGRAVFGTVDIIRDIVEDGSSILMLGRPGVGKTTKLREMARILSDEFKKRVVIVDTSNEIAGDGDIPHPAIGRSRRMQVKRPEEQHAVMIEAVENHMPQVIVIDEIGTEQEAFAARTIAERGVQLIGTAHGNSLENLLLNPTLSDLVGGIQSVTLGDEEARKRGSQKTVLERKAPPTFEVIIEILEVDKLAIHHDVAKVVDKMLRGQQPRPEIRVMNTAGDVEVVQRAELPPDRPGERSGGTYGMSFEPEPDRGENRGGWGHRGGYGGRDNHSDRGGSGRGGYGERGFDGRGYEARGYPERVNVDRLDAGGGGTRTLEAPADSGTDLPTAKSATGIVQVFPYGVSRSRLERAIANLRVPVVISRDLSGGDMVIALKSAFRKEPARLHDARARGIKVHVVKSNTYIQIENTLRQIFGMEAIAATDEDAAIQEAEDAIEQILAGGPAAELNPQNAYIRRMQHQLVEAAQLQSESVGVEPRRRLRILGKG